MAKSKKNPKSTRSSNRFRTPPYGVKPLLPYIPDGIGHIWECACCDGDTVNVLREYGYTVTATDIDTGHNFLRTPPPEGVQAIVTNPPFDKKNQFLARCYKLGLPFALLLPIDSLGTRKRQNLFDKYGIEILFLGGRIDFMTPSGKPSSAWLETAWFTWKFHLPKPMTFTKLVKPKKVHIPDPKVVEVQKNMPTLFDDIWNS